MKRIIKDPTYNIYRNGGNVETRKNKLNKNDCVLVGSSAGAMVFGVKMLREKLVNTIGIFNGLIIPHYESSNLSSDRFKIIDEFQKLSPILGIDSKTSCFYNSGTLKVIGKGKVNLFYDDQRQILFNDQIIKLTK